MIRLEMTIAKVETGRASFEDLHQAFELIVEAVEGLPWPVLKQGREMTQDLLVESWYDPSEFNGDANRAHLLQRLRDWIDVVKRADDRG